MLIIKSVNPAESTPGARRKRTRTRRGRAAAAAVAVAAKDYRRCASGERLSGQVRAALVAHVAAMYCDKRLPVRTIADEVGRSYGWVHKALAEAGVEMRRHGGYSRRGKRAAS